MSAPRTPQRYVVAEERYQPFEGLPRWLASRTEDHGFLANITTFEPDVHEHKVFDIRRPALLEHRHGYTFLRSGLMQESLTYWQLDTGPTPKGFRDYLAWLINEDSITFLPRAVSFRAQWEGNFWHLHDNVLSKLIAIDEHDLPDDVPLLVGRPLWESRYFAELRTMPAFRDRNWVLHDRPIRTDRLIVCLEGSFRRESMAFVHQSLADTPVTASPATPKLLFLYAKPASNGTSTTAHAHATARTAWLHHAPGRAVVVTRTAADVPRTRCVVLAVGAGLANVVHRIGRPTGIVEVFPADKESRAIRRVAGRESGSRTGRWWGLP